MDATDIASKTADYIINKDFQSAAIFVNILLLGAFFWFLCKHFSDFVDYFKKRDDAKIGIRLKKLAEINKIIPYLQEQKEILKGQKNYILEWTGTFDYELKFIAKNYMNDEEDIVKKIKEYSNEAQIEAITKIKTLWNELNNKFRITINEEDLVPKDCMTHMHDMELSYEDNRRVNGGTKVDKDPISKEILKKLAKIRKHFEKEKKFLQKKLR